MLLQAVFIESSVLRWISEPSDPAQALGMRLLLPESLAASRPLDPRQLCPTLVVHRDLAHAGLLPSLKAKNGKCGSTCSCLQNASQVDAECL